MTTSKSSSNGGAKSMAELMAANTSSFNVFKKGQEVEGTVKKLTPSEILLDIGAKSDAFVLEVDKNNMDNLMRTLHVGDKVKAVVLSPESEEGFPVVSLRRALDTMIYEGLGKIASAQEDVEVLVSEPTRGGFFASTDNGMKGFLPSSQVLTPDTIAGKKIKVRIIEVDRAKKRVIFSQKATEYITEPEKLRTLFPKGKKVSAEISQVAPYGIFVAVEGEGGKLVEGFVHISEISYERVENLQDLYKKGGKLEAVVLDIDPENRRVNLSVKSTLEDTFTKAAAKYKKEDKVKGAVSKVSARGVTVALDGANGFIPADKLPAGASYTVGDEVNAEVTDIDSKKRVVVLSPIVTKTFVGYR